MPNYEVQLEDGKNQAFTLLAFAIEYAQQIKTQNCVILDHVNNKTWVFEYGILKGSREGIKR